MNVLISKNKMKIEIKNNDQTFFPPKFSKKLKLIHQNYKLDVMTTLHPFKIRDSNDCLVK